MNAERRCLRGGVRDVRGVDHVLTGETRDVGAGAADVTALDQGGFSIRSRLLFYSLRAAFRSKRLVAKAAFCPRRLLSKAAFVQGCKAASLRNAALFQKQLASDALIH